MKSEQEIKNLSQIGIRMIFSMTSDFTNQLRSGLNTLWNWSKTHSYKDVKGKKFKNKEQFILKSKTTNRNVEFAKDVIRNNDKQIKIFLKLCKNRGVDVYLEKCPKNIDDLVEKYNKDKDQLTLKEQEYINAFCKLEQNKVVETYQDSVSVMFKSSDLNIVNDIARDTEQKCMDLRRRKLKAKQKADKLINRNQTEKAILR